MTIALLVLLSTTFATAGGGRASQRDLPPIRVVDVSADSGVTRRNLSGSQDKIHILEVNGNGGAFFDYDRDGDVDLLITTGSTLASFREASTPMVALYQNRGQGNFVDVTQSAGLTVGGWGMGVCIADTDNDGSQDLYVTAYGNNLLYRNLGDGTFRETASDSAVNDSRYGTGCSFGDYDRDGWLDLYVANYLVFDSEALADRGKTPDCQFMGVDVFCGPRRFTPESDVLYRNVGDGRFIEWTETAGVDERASYGFGVVSGDIDGDGWLDIYVANDSRPNFLFHNQGNGTFSEVALFVGVALSREGRQQAGMGVDIGDVDNDGFFDIFVTNFSQESNALYRGSADFVFSDVSFAAGLGGPSLPYLGWGTGLVDLDNDGWLDIVVANGHIYKEVDYHPQFGTRYAQPVQFFRNLGAGRYQDVTAVVGPAKDSTASENSSRGISFGDFDDDGDLDLFIVNLDERPSLLRNDSRTDNQWLRLRLIGVDSNRDAVGARVTVTVNEGSRLAEVRSGGSYLSHNDDRVHFGLGTASAVEGLEIRWPSGETESLADVPTRSVVTIVEGKGIVSTRARQ